MGACSSFHPRQIAISEEFPKRNNIDYPYAININLSVLLEKDEDLKNFLNENTYLLVSALNQKFCLKHISQKNSNFYKDYTLNQYYLDFFLNEAELNFLLNNHIEIHIYFFNENFYFEKKCQFTIRSEAKEGFISDDELIELDLMKGTRCFNNKNKKVRIGVKYRLFGDFIYSYINQDQKKFLSFYKFFEFLIYSKHPILEEYYSKNINEIERIFRKFKEMRPDQRNQDMDYFNEEFNNALDALFTYFYKKNLKPKQFNSNRNSDIKEIQQIQNDFIYTYGNLETEKKILTEKEFNKPYQKNFANNLGDKEFPTEFKDVNLKIEQEGNEFYGNKEIDIDLIKENNIEKEFELNHEQGKIRFIEYSLLLFPPFHEHNPTLSENTRHIQYNLNHFSKKHLFELFTVILRDLHNKIMPENFLKENLYNIIFAASVGNHKMLGIFNLIYKNEKIYQIFDDCIDDEKVFNLLRNSSYKDDIPKYDIFPFLILSEKAKGIITNPSKFNLVSNIIKKHRNGQTKLDLIELIIKNPKLPLHLLTCEQKSQSITSDNLEYNENCHSRLFNLFAYLLSLREIIELLYYNRSIGKPNNKDNENIQSIILNLKNNTEKVEIKNIVLEELNRIINNEKINVEFILKNTQVNFFDTINETFFKIIQKDFNDSSDESFNKENNFDGMITQSLIRFLRLFYKFYKLSNSYINCLFKKKFLPKLSEIQYLEIEMLENDNVEYFLEHKFLFLMNAIFSGKLREKAVRKIVCGILNNDKVFTDGDEKSTILNLSIEAAYGEQMGGSNFINKFNKYVNAEYLNNIFRKKLIEEHENIPYPIYVLTCLSKIPGFLMTIQENIGRWKDLFYTNASFEKFYVINFYDEYQKIYPIDLELNKIYLDYYTRKNNFLDDLSRGNYVSEKENDIELSNLKILSKESFSFNESGLFSILLRDKNKKSFYPIHLYLQQPKEEINSNVKSAIFLSGKGLEPTITEMNEIINLIQVSKDYSRVNYNNLKYLAYLEFDKIKKSLFKELRTQNYELCDFIIVIFLKNFENEIILTTGPFGCFGTYENKDVNYISNADYKYLKEKFLFDEL